MRRWSGRVLVSDLGSQTLGTPIQALDAFSSEAGTEVRSTPKPIPELP
jgi:hypothetical protein